MIIEQTKVGKTDIRFITEYGPLEDWADKLKALFFSLPIPGNIEYPINWQICLHPCGLKLQTWRRIHTQRPK